MGSKRSEKVVSTAIRLPRDLHARLLDEADKRVVSVNLLITNAVRFYIENLPPVPEQGRKK